MKSSVLTSWFQCSMFVSKTFFFCLSINVISTNSYNTFKSLKWASHINKISNKANSVLGFIKRNLKHTNRDLRELAYTSLVRSILEYSSTVWDPFYQKDIDRLERVQRRAARFVLNDYKPLSSVTSMVSQLGWKPLAERRREHRLSLLYKIINGLVAIPADTHLHFNTRSTRISNSKSLKLPICTTDTFKHSFFSCYYQRLELITR